MTTPTVNKHAWPLAGGTKNIPAPPVLPEAFANLGARYRFYRNEWGLLPQQAYTIARQQMDFKALSARKLRAK